MQFCLRQACVCSVFFAMIPPSFLSSHAVDTQGPKRHRSPARKRRIQLFFENSGESFTVCSTETARRSIPQASGLRATTSSAVCEQADHLSRLSILTGEAAATGYFLIAQASYRETITLQNKKSKHNFPIYDEQKLIQSLIYRTLFQPLPLSADIKAFSRGLLFFSPSPEGEKTTHKSQIDIHTY